MLVGTCAMCADVPEGLPSRVFITEGGSAYHHHADCLALIEGQSWIGRRGGQAGPVERVPIRRARDLGRQPCGGCAA